MTGKHNTRVVLTNHFKVNNYISTTWFACFVLTSTVRSSSNSSGRVARPRCLRWPLSWLPSTGMECTQCQLCARLTDRLCSTPTASPSEPYGWKPGYVNTWHKHLSWLAGQYRTVSTLSDWRVFNALCNVLGNFPHRHTIQVHADSRMNNTSADQRP